ncbi:MAG: SLATT domain-containing protein [Halopseudomonas sp.]
MNKESFLKLIADAGYNAGFGAKKHFASYDMIEKLPGLIGLLSISVGVFALVKPDLSTQDISAFVLILGVIGLYISQHSSDKDKFSKAGVELTDTFNQLKVLYHKVQNKNADDFSQELQELEELQKKYNSQAMPNQLVLSDWYAHYKFFWQHQIEWIDEQKSFGFWRDKVPLSFTLACLFVMGIWLYNVIPFSEFVTQL